MLKLLILISLLLTPTAPAPEILAEPVPLLKQSTIHTFVAPHWDKGPGHRGIDIALAQDFPLKSPFAGQVHFAGKVVGRKVITLISATGLKASFEPVCSDLVQGEKVIEGQAIGIRCEPDAEYEKHCTSCVHFSIRNEYGYLNPLLFYGGMTPPRLLG